MNENGTLVIWLNLQDENAVPLSIFCLKNLEVLTIRNMSFPNGNFSLAINNHYVIYFFQVLYRIIWKI